MGSFISSLKSNNCSNARSLPDANVDWKNASPTQTELQLCKEIELLLTESNALTKKLKQYTGCTEQIRQAISNPTDENQEILLNSLTPNLNSIKLFYEFKTNLYKAITKTLEILCSDKDVVYVLESNQALVYLLTKLLDFVFEFDKLKLSMPSLQNDFSYYKRMISRFKKIIEQNNKLHNTSDTLPIGESETSSISMFFANSSPMLKTTVEATLHYVGISPDNLNKVTNCFVGLVGVCYYGITKERAPDEKTKEVLLKSMVLCSILYDHTNNTGVFAKTSNIDIKIVIKCIEDNGDTLKENLLNGLRYNTIHLNEATTPKKIKSSLSAN